MIRKFFYVLVVGVLLTFFSGCGGGDNEDNSIVKHPGDVVSLTKTATYDQDTMKQILDQMQIPSQQVFGIEVFTLVYKTLDRFGNLINASGLLAVPMGIDFPTPLVSDQHGTVFNDEEIPSRNPLNASVILFTALRGYMLAMPDYIGYGASSDKVHPYLIEEPSARAVVDMLRAVKRISSIKNFPLGDKLFLSGYSEGGYVTMAALKKIQEDLFDEFRVTAAAPMAGPYDLKQTADVFLLQGMLSYSPFVAYLVYAYDEYYGWNRLKKIVNEPYADKLPALFDGTKSSDYIYNALTNVTNELFRPDFLASYFAGGEEYFKRALVDNSPIDWTPRMPLRLIHCTDDPIVPFFNTQTAFDNFVQNGAKDVELVSLDGDDHVECAGPAYLDAASYFDSFR
ncbi:MAG: alpha/beta fold hydrolase [Epsilonproteobacteria bacterium]|nr:alpha/beta fold hydrolase [Campylobacterota bacterium]